jgi:hypothetical protein
MRHTFKFPDVIDVQTTELLTTSECRFPEKWHPIKRVVEAEPGWRRFFSLSQPVHGSLVKIPRTFSGVKIARASRALVTTFARSF